MIGRSDPNDRSGCLVELRAGSGGAESCDLVSMLTKMYMKWAQSFSNEGQLNFFSTHY